MEWVDDFFTSTIYLLARETNAPVPTLLAAALSLLPFISITGGNVMQLHQACLLVWANLGLDYKHRHRNHLIPFQSDLENNTELFIEPAATATSPIGSAWLSLDGERWKMDKVQSGDDEWDNRRRFFGLVPFGANKVSREQFNCSTEPSIGRSPFPLHQQGTNNTNQKINKRRLSQLSFVSSSGLLGDAKTVGPVRDLRGLSSTPPLRTWRLAHTSQWPSKSCGTATAHRSEKLVG